MLVRWFSLVCLVSVAFAQVPHFQAPTRPDMDAGVPRVVILSPENNTDFTVKDITVHFIILNVEADDGIRAMIYFNSVNPFPIEEFNKDFKVTVTDLAAGDYNVKVVLIDKDRIPVGEEAHVKFKRVATSEEIMLREKKEPALEELQRGLDYKNGVNGTTQDYEKAMEEFAVAAAMGNSEAMFQLGMLYLYGDVKGYQNASMTVMALESAAHLNNSNAQHALGLLWSIGLPELEREGYDDFAMPSNWKGPRDRSRAVRFGVNETMSIMYLTQCARTRNPLCLMTLGNWYRHGLGVQADCKLAATNYRLAADRALGASVHEDWDPVINDVRLSDELPEHDLEVEEFHKYKAEHGSVDSQIEMGLRRWYGSGMSAENRSETVKYFEEAAEQGNSLAISNLAFMYLQDNGHIEKNETRAFELYTQAAQMHDPVGINGLGTMLFNGWGTNETKEANTNKTEGVRLFKIAADMGQRDAQMNLGIMYREGNAAAKLPRSYQKAMRYLSKAAGFGKWSALHYLGIMYENGEGTKPDCYIAVHYYKIAAEHGPWGRGIKDAYKAYLKGEHSRALWRYQILASMGYELASTNTAWLYETQRGYEGDDNYERAKHLYSRSAMQGSVDGHLKMGDYYFYGLGDTEIDYEQAAMHYMAAESNAIANQRPRGYGQALFNLGYLYEHGIGVPVNFTLSLHYYATAGEVAPESAAASHLAIIWLRAHIFLLSCQSSVPNMIMASLAFLALLSLFGYGLYCAVLQMPAFLHSSTTSIESAIDSMSSHFFLICFSLSGVLRAHSSSLSLDSAKSCVLDLFTFVQYCVTNVQIRVRHAITGLPPTQGEQAAPIIVPEEPSQHAVQQPGTNQELSSQQPRPAAVEPSLEDSPEAIPSSSTATAVKKRSRKKKAKAQKSLVNDGDEGSEVDDDLGLTGFEPVIRKKDKTKSQVTFALPEEPIAQHPPQKPKGREHPPQKPKGRGATLRTADHGVSSPTTHGQETTTHTASSEAKTYKPEAAGAASEESEQLAAADTKPQRPRKAGKGRGTAPAHEEEGTLDGGRAEHAGGKGGSRDVKAKAQKQPIPLPVASASESIEGARHGSVLEDEGSSAIPTEDSVPAAPRPVPESDCQHSDTPVSVPHATEETVACDPPIEPPSVHGEDAEASAVASNSSVPLSVPAGLFFPPTPFAHMPGPDVPVELVTAAPAPVDVTPCEAPAVVVPSWAFDPLTAAAVPETVTREEEEEEVLTGLVGVASVDTVEESSAPVRPPRKNRRRHDDHGGGPSSSFSTTTLTPTEDVVPVCVVREEHESPDSGYEVLQPWAEMGLSSVTAVTAADEEISPAPAADKKKKKKKKPKKKKTGGGGGDSEDSDDIDDDQAGLADLVAHAKGRATGGGGQVKSNVGDIGAGWVIVGQ